MLTQPQGDARENVRQHWLFWQYVHTNTPTNIYEIDKHMYIPYMCIYSYVYN